MTLGGLVLGWGAIVAAVACGSSLEHVARFVDASFKIAAVIVGAAWALNRHFMARTDELQLRVDPIVEIMSVIGSDRLFACRLDVVNTGKSLTPRFAQSIVLHSVIVTGGEVVYECFYSCPSQEAHLVAAVEPGSWSAISIAVALPTEIHVVQVYLELRFETGVNWTWHRHFSALEPHNGL